MHGQGDCQDFRPTTARTARELPVQEQIERIVGRRQKARTRRIRRNESHTAETNVRTLQPAGKLLCERIVFETKSACSLILARIDSATRSALAAWRASTRGMVRSRTQPKKAASSSASGSAGDTASDSKPILASFLRIAKRTASWRW